MANKKEFVERRKHKRFKVKDSAIVAVKDSAFVAVLDTTPGYINLGRFINISKGGLAFRYDDRKGESTEPFKVDILSVQDSFYLYNIPFKTIWVSHAAGKPSFSFSKTSKQGVQFGDMAPSQIQHLDSFIEKYAIR